MPRRDGTAGLEGRGVGRGEGTGSYIPNVLVRGQETPCVREHRPGPRRQVVNGRGRGHQGAKTGHRRIAQGRPEFRLRRLEGFGIPAAGLGAYVAVGDRGGRAEKHAGGIGLREGGYEPGGISGILDEERIGGTGDGTEGVQRIHHQARPHHGTPPRRLHARFRFHIPHHGGRSGTRHRHGPQRLDDVRRDHALVPRRRPRRKSTDARGRTRRIHRFRHCGTGGREGVRGRERPERGAGYGGLRGYGRGALRHGSGRRGRGHRQIRRGYSQRGGKSRQGSNGHRSWGRGRRVRGRSNRFRRERDHSGPFGHRGRHGGQRSQVAEGIRTTG
mmetsp:Transcript_22706/g.46035  ORF Transcript_22706/g.46035 Transcript_22706/m.46035 type:complete len:330 (+) Transcript_22706:911-1900(+)